jgi:ubiquinone biosynthesis protein
MSLLGFWRKHYRDLPRIRQIIAVASRHGFGQLVEQIGLQRFISLGRRMLAFKRPPAPEHRISAAERLRSMFEELGPTFIKLGQILSCRPDMLPIEYAQELSKLTDSVAPFPFDEARAIIEDELGAPIPHLFARFETEPEAAASIAQVFRGTLWDGADVIVKVRRPHIERVIARDISILRGLGDLIEAHVPDMAVYNVRGIVDEFAKTINRELDFFIEASNAAHLRRNFENSAILYVPRVYSELSTKRVLVLERLEGFRIDDFGRIDALGLDRTELSKKGSAAFFQMVLQDGFFHADPHPGNLFVLPDGRLGLVDFGMMGRVDDQTMEHFASVFVALVSRDFDTIVDQYMEMGFLSDETIDIEQFRRELREELAELLEPYYGMTSQQIDFSAYTDRVTSILVRYRLRLPQNLYLVDKALITLEGIVRQLDPDFDYFETAKPFVARLIGRKRSPLRIAKGIRKNAEEMYDLLTVLPRQMKTIFRKVLHGDLQVKLKHEELGRVIRDIDKSSNRLSFSVLTAAIVIASSIVIHSGQGQKLFGLPLFGLVGYILAAFLGIWLLIGILRSGQL